MKKKEENAMHARLVIAQIKPESLDEFKRTYEENNLPDIKSQPGCQGVYLLLDRAASKAISMTLWDSEEHANADEQSEHYQKRVSKVKGYFAASPMREKYEVAVQG